MSRVDLKDFDDILTVMAKKAGRPKTLKRGQHRAPFGVALNPVERKILEEAAKRDGMQLGPWCRTRLLEAARK